MQPSVVGGSQDRTAELATCALLDESAVNLTMASATRTRSWEQLMANSVSSACPSHAVPAKCTLFALQDEYADEPGTVIASDFYHSNELMPLSDEAIINRVVSNMGACEPAFLGARVSTVGKAWICCCGCGSVRLHTPCQQPSRVNSGCCWEV